MTKKTDIELGILIQLDKQGTQLMDMLSTAYPSLRVSAPQKNGISNK